MKGKLILATLIALLGYGCSTDSVRYSSKDYKLSNAAAETRVITAADANKRVKSTDKSATKAPDRELTYKGEAHLVTDDIPDTSKAIREDLKQIGGYLFSMTSTRLDLRIPSLHLESFVNGLAKYGKIKSSNIQAEDVTDKHFDIRVRIENLEKMRQRLLALTDKSKKVEDTLKLERELARVTAELEKLKGLLNRGNQDVKYSKLLVHLTSTEPMYKKALRTPFAWVNGLAHSLKNPYVPKPYKGGWFSRKIEADLMEGFANIYNNKDHYWAMNGNGRYYHIYRVENQVEDADLKFWKKTVEKYLKEGKLMNILSTKEVKSKSGKGFQISASYGSGKDKLTYVIQVVPGEDRILVSELWGVVGDVTSNTELLQEVMKNVETSL